MAGNSGPTSFSVRLTSPNPDDRHVGLLSYTFVVPVAGSYLFNIDSSRECYITVDDVVTPLNAYRNEKDGVILTLDVGKRVTAYGTQGIQVSGCLLHESKT